MRVILALAVLILGSTGGEIAITHGMKATGEPARLRPMALLQFLGRAVRNGWFWAGVPLMALSFYSLLVLLSWEPISFVIPASALSYVGGALGGCRAGLRGSCLGRSGLTTSFEKNIEQQWATSDSV